MPEVGECESAAAVGTAWCAVLPQVACLARSCWYRADHYYNDTTFSTLEFTRTESLIDFNWGGWSSDPPLLSRPVFFVRRLVTKAMKSSSNSIHDIGDAWMLFRWAAAELDPCVVVAGVTGKETAFDLYDFEAGRFEYNGFGFYTSIGFAGSMYIGAVTGWSKYPRDRGIHNYAGPAEASSQGFALPVKFLSGDVQGFTSGQLTGAVVSINAGAGVAAPLDLSKIWTSARLVEWRDFHAPGMNPTAHDGARFLQYLSQEVKNPAGLEFVRTIVKANTRI